LLKIFFDAAKIGKCEKLVTGLFKNVFDVSWQVVPNDADQNN